MNLILKNKQTQIIAEWPFSRGSLSKAKKFIKLVKKWCRHCKISIHIADESHMTKSLELKSKKYKNRFDYWKKTSFSKRQWKELITFKNKKYYFYHQFLV